MVIVTGIKTGIEIAKIFGRFAKSTGKYNPALRAIDKYSPPHLRAPLRKAVRYGEAAVAAKGVYDLLNIDNNVAIPPKKIRTPQKRQTRNNMVTTGRRRSYKSTKCYPPKRYPSF